MLKMKNLVENFDLARLALKRWKYDEQTLTQRLSWFRVSSNAVYPFDSQGRLCFLRLSPAQEKQERELLGELDFLIYLSRHDYPAMRPIPADNGKTLVKLDTPWGTWYASAFEGVPGRPLEDIPMTRPLAQTYGSSLGRLHALSMGYRSPVARRSELDALEWIQRIFEEGGAPKALTAQARETARQLAALARERERYGLVHYDFEPDNVFWDGEKCSVIDFEDGMLHFYAVDVVQALDELAPEYHQAFLNGYRAVCPGSVYESDFALMRRFRDLYACARLMDCLAERPVPEPDWMPQLVMRLQARLDELKRGLIAAG